MTPTQAEALAEAVAVDGIAAHHPSVAALAAAARAAGVAPTLAAIVADPDQPEVARLRALGRLVAAWCSTPTAAPAPAGARPRPPVPAAA